VGPAGLSRPSPSGDGSLVAFSSQSDPLGLNGDHNFEVFLVDVATLATSQVTKGTGGAGSFDASLSADGARVALASDRNLSGRNGDENVEIFRIDLADGAVAQVTDAAGATSVLPVTFGDGESLYFLSTMGSGDGSLQLHVADGCVPAPVVSRVRIDVMPKSRRNRIDVSSRGLVRVAILTTSVADGDERDFDAASVAPKSVRFGPAGARQHRSRIKMRDVDRDGDRDMILNFKISETGIELGDVEACLTGLTADGAPFDGCDAIETYRKNRR
jgi:hypothetical protein